MTLLTNSIPFGQAEIERLGKRLTRRPEQESYSVPDSYRRPLC